MRNRVSLKKDTVELWQTNIEAWMIVESFLGAQHHPLIYPIARILEQRKDKMLPLESFLRLCGTFSSLAHLNIICLATKNIKNSISKHKDILPIDRKLYFSNCCADPIDSLVTKVLINLAKFKGPGMIRTR